MIGTLLWISCFMICPSSVGFISRTFNALYISATGIQRTSVWRVRCIVFNVQYFQCLLHCREINFTYDGHFKILLNSFCVDLEHISESILWKVTNRNLYLIFYFQLAALWFVRRLWDSSREHLMLCISVLRVSGRNTIQHVMESLFTDIFRF
jgi:hypothetical protein